MRPIITHVGHTGTNELHFQGRRVFAELLGHASASQVIVLGVSGMFLETEHIAAVDEIVTVMSSADPRLWPFKVTRLASSYGGAPCGVAATLVAGEGGMYGTKRVLAIATWLADLARHGRALSDDDVEATLQVRAEGFGVAGRSRDERFDALLRHLEQRGHESGRHLQMLRQIVPIARQRLGLEPHIYLAIAALCLDLGLTPNAIAMIGVLVLFNAALANASEGAIQRPASLHALGVQNVAYLGKPPRSSPLAQIA